MRRLRNGVRSVVLACLVMLPGADGAALAAGYFVPEMDAEAMGQAMSWVARPRGPSAVFFNPAGLTLLEGWELSFGTTLVAWESKAVGPLPLTLETQTINAVEPPSHAYIAYKLNDRIALGIGVNNAWGLVLEWPQRWPEGLDFGSYIVEEVDLRTFNINPTVAYAVNENLSIGVGLQWVLSTAKLENQSNILDQVNALLASQGQPPLPGLEPLQIGLDADNGGGDFGFDVGLLYNTEKFGFGLTYRSEVTLDLEGDTEFIPPRTGIPTLDAALGQTFASQGGSTEVPIPDVIAGGMAFRPTDRIELSADVEWTNWSDFELLDIRFENLPPSVSEELWENGFTYRIGGSYDLSETLEGRLGFIFDPTVIPDDTLRPLLPESDRFALTAGLGVKLGALDLDLAYLFLTLDERTVSSDVQIDGFGATYDTHAHLFGVTFSYGGGR